MSIFLSLRGLSDDIAFLKGSFKWESTYLVTAFCSNNKSHFRQLIGNLDSILINPGKFLYAIKCVSKIRRSMEYFNNAVNLMLCM